MKRNLCASIATLLAISASTTAFAGEPTIGEAAFSSEATRLQTRLHFADEAASRVSLGMLQDDETTGSGELDTPADDGNDMETEMRRASRAGNFGAAETWRINFGAGFSIADAGPFYQGIFSFTYFIVDDFSIDFQLGGYWFDQDGPATYGGSIDFIFRWHFYAQATWSLYLDGGVGFLKSSDDVPDNGSNYNFTPQLGLGVSFDVGHDWRVLTGVRWHHISNADLADSNPGRDGIQIYAMLSLPF